jgi:hypothetical protein
MKGPGEEEGKIKVIISKQLGKSVNKLKTNGPYLNGIKHDMFSPFYRKKTTNEANIHHQSHSPESETLTIYFCRVSDLT